MRASLARLAQYGLETSVPGVGHDPLQVRTRHFQSFKSKFGPKYKTGWHFAGINMSNGAWYASLAGGMAVPAGIFALFFFNGVPRVQKDILQKVPFLGDFFVHEVPPEDNPF